MHSCGVVSAKMKTVNREPEPCALPTESLGQKVTVIPAASFTLIYLF